MNSWEINKIAGAVLGSLAFVLGVSVVSDVIFTEKPPEEPGYRVEIPDEAETQVAEAPAEPAFATLLAQADADAGERDARVCAACHSFEQGGPTKVGPNLWNIVGNDVMHVADFNYSSGMQDWGEGKAWSYDNLDAYLEDPAGTVPGTNMAYAGIKDDQKRANVIMYLRSISPDAPPLPEPPAETEVAAADPTMAADDGTAAPASGTQTFAQLVAAADPAEGERGARVCAACHSFNEGGPTKVGPNLWNIVGNDVLHAEDYTYSTAMQDWAQDHPVWTIAELDAYLEDPMGVVPGTKMAYAGIKDDEDRAAVVAYLVSISPDAPPIQQASAPATTETAAAQDAASADTATDATPEGGPSPAEAAPATDDDAEQSMDAAGGTAGGEPQTPAAGTASPEGDAADTDDRAAAPAGGDTETETETAAADTGSAAGDGTAADASASDAASTAGSGETQMAAASPAEQTGDQASAGAGGELAAFVDLVRQADPASAPASVTAVCQACHSVEEGGPTMVGPNLWNVVGGPVLHADGFAYSDAFQQFAQDHPTWTIAELDKYLADPMGYVPGTNMAFAGVPDEKDRAAVIAWLRSLSNDPVSLDDPTVVGSAD